MIAYLRSLWRNLTGRRRVDRDLDEELTALHALLIDEKIAAGMTPADARRAAAIELGHPHIIAQHVKDARAGAFLETLAQDVRYGTRLLRRNPLFTMTAVLSLAIGIGANTTIFSLVNALMLRDLRVANPGELVELGRITQYGRGGSFSYPIYEAIRDQNAAFQGVLAMSKSTMNAAVDAERPPAGRLVSGNFFEVLGVRPQLGRLFSAADDNLGSPDAAAVAVITDGLWHRQFGASGSAVGATLRIEKVSFTVIGVLPAAFDDPLVGRGADFFMPMASERWLRRRSWLSQPDFNWLGIVGRLKPGVSLTAASANLEPIFARYMDGFASRQQDPDAQRSLRSQRMFLQSGRTGLSDLRRDFSKPALLLMGAVSLVLLIACANVVNLLLARGVLRRREIALRLAIGAGRGRLVRQLLTESAVLGLAGGAVGLVIASFGAPLLLALASQGAKPLALDVAPDARLVLFAFAVSMASSLVAGTTPALRTARADITPAFQGDQRSLSLTRSSTRWGQGLIAFQIALSLLLLVGASLLVATLRNIRTFDPGFDREHVLLIGLDPAKAGYEGPRASQYYRDVLTRVRAIPGVRAASLSMITPIGGGGIDNGFSVDARPSVSRQMVYVNITSEGFFSTMGTPLVLGRDFVPADGERETPAVIVNDALVRRFFNGENPLGQRVTVGRRSSEIVGVVANAKYMSLREEDQPTVYAYALGTPEPVGFTLSVKTEGDPLIFAPVIRKDVQSLGASVPVGLGKTLSSEIDRSLVNERLVARLLGTFAVLALLLAAVGLYGVLGYSVARRTAEIGVRLALGATRTTVLHSVLRESWMLTVIGSAIGVPAAILLSRFLKSLLYGVTPGDPRVIAGAVAGLFVVAMAAAAVPAWRASRVDPLVALRHD